MEDYFSYCMQGIDIAIDVEKCMSHAILLVGCTIFCFRTSYRFVANPCFRTFIVLSSLVPLDFCRNVLLLVQVVLESFKSYKCEQPCDYITESIKKTV